MAPKPETAEAIVLNFVNEQNRPLNVQNVADALQKFAVKKTAAQKALDSLADSGQISFKEYGKQKIYLARQDQFKIPNNEEIEELKKENERLQKELESENAANNALEAELRVMGSNLTLEQIKEKDKKLNEEIIQMETKLSKLRGGIILVTPEERRKIQELFNTRISQWRKRKRIFKDLWAIITETMPNDLKEFKEELGIELDEDVGENLEEYLNLGTKKQRC